MREVCEISVQRELASVKCAKQLLLQGSSARIRERALQLLLEFAVHPTKSQIRIQAQAALFLADQVEEEPAATNKATAEGTTVQPNDPEEESPAPKRVDLPENVRNVILEFGAQILDKMQYSEDMKRAPFLLYSIVSELDMKFLTRIFSEFGLLNQTSRTALCEEISFLLG